MGKTIFRTAFADYLLGKIIAQGGSGRVYEALADDGITVAIKVLHEQNKQKKKRFKQEIHFCGNTEHPNILRVIDSGIAPAEFAEAPFYVMKRYPETLRSVIGRAPDGNQVLRVFDQILLGMQAAHERNVVHRDLKPENILCDSKANEVVIADFGIAHFQQEDWITAIETRNQDRLANFAYRAPEQLDRDAKAGATADIWALGLMLNELFTGRMPSGTNFPTIGSRAPDFEYLDPIVHKALEHAPAARFQSIAEMRQDVVLRRQIRDVEKGLAATPTRQVVTTGTNDPLLQDPLKVIGFDYRGRTIILKLSGNPNAEWQQCFRHVGGNGITWFVASEWQFSANEATNNRSSDERLLQEAIDQFKSYLQPATDYYRSVVESRRLKEQQNADEKRRAEIASEERRLRVLSSVKI